MYTGTQTDSTSIISDTNVSHHAERRKIWNRGFTPTALKSYDEIILKRSTQLVERLGQQTGVVDLGKWIGYFKWVCKHLFIFQVWEDSFDFMGDLTWVQLKLAGLRYWLGPYSFGGGFEMMQEGGDSHGLWSIILEGMRYCCPPSMIVLSLADFRGLCFTSHG